MTDSGARGLLSGAVAPPLRPSGTLLEAGHGHAARPGLRTIIRRDWRLVVGCAVLAVAASIAVTTRMPRTYEAAASLRIQNRPATLPALDILARTATAEEISTEIEALRSRTLAEDVVDSLGARLDVVAPLHMTRSELLTDLRIDSTAPAGPYRILRQPANTVRIDSGAPPITLATARADAPIVAGGLSFRLAPAATMVGEIDLRLSSLADATDEVQRRLQIERPVRDANIIMVRFRSSDPRLARDLPNEIVRRFIAHRQSVWQREARSASAFLREQLQPISRQLRAAEDSLRAFREAGRVVDPQEEGRTQIARIAEVRAQLGQLEAERASLAKLLHAVDSASRASGNSVAPYRDLVAFPSLLRNQAASQLLVSLSTLEDRRAELLTRRSMKDADVQQLTTRITQLEQQLRSLTRTYLQSLTDQIASHASTLARSSAQLDALPGRALAFARLERQTKLLGDMQTLLQTRLKESEIAAASIDGTVQQVDAARLPRRPVSPRPVLNAGLGLLAGLLLGAGAAFSRQLADRTVNSRNELVAATELPVLGMLPLLSRSRRWPGSGDGARRLAASDSWVGTHGRRAWAIDPSLRQIAFEAFNRLDANLTFAQRQGRLRTLVVTSPLPGEGKSSVASNLALAAAMRGSRVLLVDADLRRGLLGELFEQTRVPGLADVLEDRAQLGDAIRVLALGQGGALHLMTTGTLPVNPAQLLSSDRMGELVGQLRAEYDSIIFDTPPVNVVADAALLGALSEGVLIVARAGVTTPEALAIAIEQIRRVRPTVIGTVLNALDVAQDQSYTGAFQYYVRATRDDVSEQGAAPPRT